MKRSREPEEGEGAYPSGPTQRDAQKPTPTTAPSRTATSEGNIQNPVNGNEATAQPSPPCKIVELDPAGSDNDSGGVEMRCSMPPHKEPLVFSTYEEYEAHYNSTHTNRCVECRKNFPSAHLLGLHIEENHDAFSAVRRDKGEHTYSCFVEGCKRKCLTPQKRRMHLIDKHMYPKNFFFAITRDGIDGRRSLLLEGGHRRRRSSIATMTAATARTSRAQPSAASASADTDASTSTEKTEMSPEAEAQAADTEQNRVEQPADVEMDGLAGAMSALQFVPPSIRFGRGRKKAGFSKS
ncbi:hypothetical protein B0T22DRAFT_12902 [Podospora appendiculata]|uniref:C2H2-type domain-containing protein n=1 Tax=Podospora appendiculata TaxID=314037 RepID=A0AAE1CFI0_9PEZI|nr:hypothetical protein B0T22DRAFT_12902 [Podospora appendiculata]